MTLDQVGLLLDGLTTLAIILIPIVVLLVGIRVANAVRDRETNVTLLELAIVILSEVPCIERHDDEQKALRTWATGVFNAHSEIRLPESTQHALVERMPLVGVLCIWEHAMCLSVPAKVIEIDGSCGKADVGGNIVDVNFMMLEGVRLGDYVLVHAGFALQKYERQEALETLELLKGVLDANK